MQLRPDIVEAFQRDGYVVVPDLLSAEEIERFEAAVTGAVRHRREGIEIAPFAERSRYQQSFIQCMNLWEDRPRGRSAHVPSADRRRRRPSCSASPRSGSGTTRRSTSRPVAARPTRTRTTRTGRSPRPRRSPRGSRSRGRRVASRCDGATCRARISIGCASSSTSSSASPKTSSPTPRSVASSRCSSRCRADRSRSTTV